MAQQPGPAARPECTGVVDRLLIAVTEKTTVDTMPDLICQLPCLIGKSKGRRLNWPSISCRSGTVRSAAVSLRKYTCKYILVPVVRGRCCVIRAWVRSCSLKGWQWQRVGHEDACNDGTAREHRRKVNPLRVLPAVLEKMFCFSSGSGFRGEADGMDRGRRRGLRNR